MKASKIVLLLFLLFPFPILAQSTELFFTELSEGWESGNTTLLTQLMDDQVNISSNGKERSYSRSEATEELLSFFVSHQPVSFSIKHKGSSPDGQVYMIGWLNTREGKNYKIVCRARSQESGHRVFKLDMLVKN